MARRNPGEELQVVLEDERVDRTGGDVDHTSLWIAQPDEEKQEALFVVTRAFELLEFPLVERE
jgi:hypothetical protein